MARNIIDNRTVRLVDRVGDLLQDGAVRARFAVGYLFLDGLGPLQRYLRDLPEIAFLIGNVVNRVPGDILREEADSRLRGGEDWVRDQEDVAATLRAAHDWSSVETALNLRATIVNLPRTSENRELLLTMARRIADGALKVRLYPQGRIHAKAALVDYPAEHRNAPGLAIVGTSNLSLAAQTHPTEMNVMVRETADVAALGRWYDGLWKQGQDFHRELFDELGQSWALEI